MKYTKKKKKTRSIQDNKIWCECTDREYRFHQCNVSTDQYVAVAVINQISHKVLANENDGIRYMSDQLMNKFTGRICRYRKVCMHHESWSFYYFLIQSILFWWQPYSCINKRNWAALTHTSRMSCTQRPSPQHTNEKALIMLSCSCVSWIFHFDFLLLFYHPVCNVCLQTVLLIFREF